MRIIWKTRSSPIFCLWQQGAVRFQMFFKYLTSCYTMSILLDSYSCPPTHFHNCLSGAIKGLRIWVSWKLTSRGEKHCSSDTTTCCVKRSVIFKCGRKAKLRNEATVTWFMSRYTVLTLGRVFNVKIQMVYQLKWQRGAATEKNFAFVLTNLPKLNCIFTFIHLSGSGF